MDKSTICTMALGLIGESDFSPDSTARAACDLYFSQALNELLASHDWSFARRARSLQADERGEYPLPHDCLHVVEVSGLKHWRIYGSKIVSEEDEPSGEPARLVYTSASIANRGEVPDHSPEFARALVLLLASWVAVRLTANQRLRQELMQEAVSWQNRAIARDVKQDASNDQHPLRELLNQSIVC